MGNGAKTRRTFAPSAHYYSAEVLQARLDAHVRGWIGVELDSPYGARTREELAEIRSALVRSGSYPGFGKGLEFLKMRPPRPWEKFQGWDTSLVKLQHPDSEYEDHTWAPNYPGDYVGVKLITQAEQDVVRARFAKANQGRDTMGPLKPRLWAEGMDDSNEELSVDSDEAGMEIIQLLIAAQPLCRADFKDLGFRYL